MRMRNAGILISEDSAERDRKEFLLTMSLCVIHCLAIMKRKTDALGQFEQLVLGAVLALEQQAYGVPIHHKVCEMATRPVHIRRMQSVNSNNMNGFTSGESLASQSLFWLARRPKE
jgi:hypothetical protein